MHPENLIAIEEFCVSHHIEISFISSLQETGLIEVTSINEARFIEADQLQKLERMVRFHYDLDINLEGIEAITYLLQRIISLQDQMGTLQNRLRLYEKNV